MSIISISIRNSAYAKQQQEQLYSLCYKALQLDNLNPNVKQCNVKHMPNVAH